MFITQILKKNVKQFRGFNKEDANFIDLYRITSAMLLAQENFMSDR